jgi:molecular chaperone GrpE
MSKEKEINEKIDELRKLKDDKREKQQGNEKTNEKHQEHKKEENKKTDANRDAKQSPEQQIEELTDTLQRLQAEFENYKKRVDKERQAFAKYAQEDLIIKLLPMMDSFEIALKNTTDKDKFVKGIEMIYAQFYQILENAGLMPINTTGCKFDCHRHEVLMKIPSDKEEDTIIDELQKGYMLNGKIIRYSKVKVSQGKRDDKQKDACK